MNKARSHMSAMLVRISFVATLSGFANAALALECKDLWSFIGTACTRSGDAWNDGRNEVVLSGYAYHLRSTYTEEKLAELNEEAWGIGLARTVDDPDGDQHTIYAYGFRESHNKIQWNVGYLYTAWWGPKDGLRAGIGVTALLVQRPDIANGIPIPAVLPVASLGYGKFTLMSTFIPTINGGVNNGSVAYFFGRYSF